MGDRSLTRNGHHQPLAPLGTPPPENIDAILGAHPHPKTVSSFPPDFTRLIRAFHGICSLLPGFSQRALLSTVWSASQEKKKLRDSHSFSNGGVFPCNLPGVFARLTRLVQTLILDEIPLKKQAFLPYPHLFVTLWISNPVAVAARDGKVLWVRHE